MDEDTITHGSIGGLGSISLLNLCKFLMCFFIMYFQCKHNHVEMEKKKLVMTSASNVKAQKKNERLLCTFRDLARNALYLQC